MAEIQVYFINVNLYNKFGISLMIHWYDYIYNRFRHRKDLSISSYLQGGNFFLQIAKKYHNGTKAN